MSGSTTARSVGPPPPLHTRKVLFESLGIAVVDFRCRAQVCAADGAEELNPVHSILLVRRGVYRRTRRRETVLADVNHVMLDNAGETYCYAHPLLTVDTGRALELVARHSPAHAEDPGRPFRRGHGLSSPRSMWLHWEFLNLVGRQAGRLALEDTLAELADEAVACAYRSPAGSRRASPVAVRRRRELVEAAKLMISQRLESPPSLTVLAGALDCSPYHLSHTFHRTLGLSLRSYLRRLRTRVAAERLASGADSLTALALDLGYADHSHFTNSFRREWGVSP